MTMYQVTTPHGTNSGMGLSSISSVHLFEKGFHRDRNYFIRMSDQQMLIFRGSVKRPHRETLHENSLANLRKKKKTEGISSASRRKIMKYIDAWFNTIEYAKTEGTESVAKINKFLAMITLTLPTQQFHDDRYIKRHALMMFIKDLRRHSSTINYLWKAETQQNGNIHFHIIIDEYVDKSKIDAWWKARMRLLDYEQTYEKKTGKKDPPMANTESLKNKASAGRYVAKYFSKNENRRQVEGRCWGCSDRIKELAIAEMSVNESELNECLQKIDVSIASAYITDYCVIMKDVMKMENLVNYALGNYRYGCTMKKNVDILYNHQYDMFKGEIETDWERDLIEEVGHLNCLYLFENEMIGY